MFWIITQAVAISADKSRWVCEFKQVVYTRQVNWDWIITIKKWLKTKRQWQTQGLIVSQLTSRFDLVFIMITIPIWTNIRLHFEWQKTKNHHYTVYQRKHTSLRVELLARFYSNKYIILLHWIALEKRGRERRRTALALKSNKSVTQGRFFNIYSILTHVFWNALRLWVSLLQFGKQMLQWSFIPHSAGSRRLGFRLSPQTDSAHSSLQSHRTLLFIRMYNRPWQWHCA